MRDIGIAQTSQLDVPLALSVLLLLMISRMEGAALAMMRGAELLAIRAAGKEAFRAAVVAECTTARTIRR